MLRVAIRNLVTYKGRTAATVLAVALAAAFLGGTLVLTDSARAALDSSFERTYANVDVHVQAHPTFGSPGGARPVIAAGVVDRVAAVDGVAQAEARIAGYAQVFDRGGTPVGSPDESVGANWSALDGNPFRLVTGRAPATADEVVVDRGTAKAAGLDVGDVAKVATNAGPVSVTVAGISRFGAVDSPGGAPYVLFTQAAAERLLAPPGHVDGVVAVAEPGITAEVLRARIASALGGDLEVLTSDEVAAEDGAVGAGATNAIRTLLLAFAAVALFVGGFIVNNTFSILVAQRTREVGLLRALGASRRQVLGSVLAEASLVGVLGAAAGALAGIGVAAALRGLVADLGFDMPSGPLVVAPASVVAPVVAGTLLTVAAAAFPARHAAAVPPVAALGHAAIDRSSQSRRRLVVGGALLAVGAVLVVAPLVAGAESAPVIGFGAAIVFLGLGALSPAIAPPVVRFLGHRARALGGAPLELARENTARHGRRTAGAATSLMIGTALVTLIAVFAASAKATVSQPYAEAPARPDFVVQSASMEVGGFSPTLAARLARLPEIERIAVSRTAVADVGGQPGLHVHGVDPRPWAEMAGDTTVRGTSTGLQLDEVSVLEIAATTNRWTIGDVVTARIGDRERQLRIAGTRSSGPPFLVGLDTYDALVPEQLDSAILARKRPGVSTAVAEKAVRAVLRDYPTATLLDARGKSPQQVAGIDQFANAVYVLLGLALLISLIGIGTTLALSVVERTREIGLLRAVGMTATQVTAMVRWESLLIVLFGCSLGVTSGLLFGVAILQTVPDDVVFRIPVVQILAVTGLAAAAALVAAAGPARRASRLQVLTAIARP